MIFLNNISKTYYTKGGSVPALSNVTMHVRPGEFAALIGESGSGKSTLMNIAGCLDSPTGGDVIICGRNTRSMTENDKAALRRECIGFIFQSFYLQNYMTALENVMLPLVFAGIPQSKRKKRASELMDDMGLSQRMHHTPAQLSGGQKQRVAIARALAASPKLILADEPTGNLDSKTATGIMELLKRLSQSGIAILMVTHNSRHISYADSCYKINDGRLRRM